MVAVAHERPLDLQPAQRVGPVEHHHRDAQLGAGTHHQAERGDEGVGAAAHVLDVIDHDIDALQHLFRRLPGAAEERVYRQAGVGVLAGLHLAAGIHVAAHAVLRSVEGDQVDARRLEEDVDGGTQLAVHPGGVGDQPDALAFQASEMALPQDLDAGLDPGSGGQDGAGLAGAGAQEEQRCRAKNVTETVARQHIMTTIKKPT